MSVFDVDSEPALEKLLAGPKGVVLMFWAEWHEPCKQMVTVLMELARDHPSLCFARVEAEQVSEIAERFEIESVPTIIVFAKGKAVETLEGASVPKLVAMVGKQAKAIQSQPTAAAPVSKEDINVRLSKLVKAAPVMLFMKGSPDAPKCGFSRKTVEILKECGAKYGFFDILTDDEVRQGLKTFSNWPTFPQLYIKGELTGGIDVIKELQEEGELSDMLKEAMAGSGGDINSRIKAVLKQNRVMVFMKGEPAKPQCGFSRTLIGILREAGFKEFGHFDILLDDEIRQGLKVYSNWPTYPQLYIDGELVGGLDVIKEMHEEGELAELVPK